MNYPVYRLTCPATGRTVYCEWVGNADAPCKSFLNADHVRQYWEDDAMFALDLATTIGGPEVRTETAWEHEHTMARIHRRMDRLVEKGHTLLDEPSDGEGLVSFNRAGNHGENLTLAQLVSMLIERAERPKEKTL